jgi:hypothetical protein
MANVTEPWLRPWGGAQRCVLENLTSCDLGQTSDELQNVDCTFFGSEMGYLCSCTEGRSGAACEQVSFVSRLWGLLFLAIPLRAAYGLCISASTAREFWLTAVPTARSIFVLSSIAHFALGIGGLVTSAYFLGLLDSSASILGLGSAWSLVFIVMIAMRSIVAHAFYSVVARAEQKAQTRSQRLLGANTVLQIVTLVGWVVFFSRPAYPILFSIFRSCECLQVGILVHATVRLRAVLAKAESTVDDGSKAAELLRSLISRSYLLARQLLAYLLVVVAHVAVIAVDTVLPSDHALPAVRYVFDRLVGFAFQLVTTQMVIWIVRYFRAPLDKKATTAGRHAAVKPGRQDFTEVPTSAAVSSAHPVGPRGSIARVAPPKALAPLQEAVQ